MLISLFFGFLVGATMGLTGSGGGILGVPVLVFGMGWSMQQAAPVALAAVVVGSAIGSIEGLRRKLVRYKAATLIAAAGAATIPFGVSAAHVLPSTWLSAMFAVLLLIVAFRLFSSASYGNSGTVEPQSGFRWSGHIDPQTGRFVWNWPTAILLASIGAVTGFLTGMLGVGGGFLIVPMLRKFTDMSLHGIVATTLLVTGLLGVAAAINAVLHGVQVPVADAAAFAGATGAGMLAGRRLAGRLSGAQIQRGFAAVLVVVAFLLAGRSLGLV